MSPVRETCVWSSIFQDYITTMSMLPNYSRTVFGPRPPLGLHYFCNLRIVIVTNEDTALEGYTPRLRPCFTSRYPCTREVEGDWGTDNGLHPSSLFPNFHGDNAQLCGFGQVTNIINYSNRDFLACKAIACAKDISRLLGWQSPFERRASYQGEHHDPTEN